MNGLHVRPATLEDAELICAIYNQGIEDRLATLETELLTPTERRIAELAATGAHNKEIAGALFVSVKTVEANLSRVYTKLGIRSRVELASRLPKREQHEAGRATRR